MIPSNDNSKKALEPMLTTMTHDHDGDEGHPSAHDSRSDYLNVKETADALDLSVPALLCAVSSNKIPYVIVRGHLLFSVEELDAYLVGECKRKQHAIRLRLSIACASSPFCGRS